MSFRLAFLVRFPLKGASSSSARLRGWGGTEESSAFDAREGKNKVSLSVRGGGGRGGGGGGRKEERKKKTAGPIHNPLPPPPPSLPSFPSPPGGVAPVAECKCGAIRGEKNERTDGRTATESPKSERVDWTGRLKWKFN